MTEAEFVKNLTSAKVQNTSKKATKNNKLSEADFKNWLTSSQPTQQVTQPVVQPTAVSQETQTVQPRANHAQVAQQAHTNLATKQQTPLQDEIIGNVNVTNLRKAAAEKGISNEEVEYAIGRLKAEQTPRLQTKLAPDTVPNYQAINEAQLEKEQKYNPVTMYDKSYGKQEGKEEVKNLDFSKSNNADKYIEYKEGLKQAQATGDTRNIAKNETAIKEFEKKYEEKNKDKKQEYNIPAIRNALNEDIAGLNELNERYNNTTDIAEKNRIADSYINLKNKYDNRLAEYQEALTYDELINDNIGKDIASSFGTNVLGGTANIINAGYSGGTRLAGLDVSTLNPTLLKMYVDGNMLGSIDATKLQGIAQLEPNNTRLQNLATQIKNKTYTGTAEDLKKELDEIQKERYQGFKDRFTQDELDKVVEQQRHNEIYGKAATIPNAFGTVGNMVPSILAGIATGGVAELAGGGAMAAAGTLANTAQQVGSLGTLGMGAFSSGLDQALQEGATYNQGVGYGALTAATEVGTELIGGETVNKLFGRYGKTALGKVFGKAIDELNIESKVGRFIANQVSGVASEVTEEMISEALNPLWQTITYNPEALPKNLPEIGKYIKNVIKAGAEAIPSTIIMQGSGNVMQARNVQMVENSLIDSINKTDLSQDDYANLKNNYNKVTQAPTQDTENRLKKLNDDFDYYSQIRDKNYDKIEELRKEYEKTINSQDFKNALNIVTSFDDVKEAVKSPEYQKLVEAQRMQNQIKDLETENDVAKKEQDRIWQEIENLEKKNRTPENAVKQAKELFGTTTNFNAAAYILQDGDMLDFSGASQGSGVNNRRTLDHRDINQVGYDMDEFIGLGNIRLQPEGNGFQLMIEPTEKQYKMLENYINQTNGEVFIDIYKEGRMAASDSAEYKKNTPTSKIIDDLRQYFKTGKFPAKSQYADFLYSKQNTSWQDFLDQNLNLAQGTKTNFERLPTNEELQQQDTKAVEQIAESSEALRLEEKPKKKKLTQQERDTIIQEQIEKNVLEAVGDDFNRETLLKRLRDASQKADEEISKIDMKKRKTNADEDIWTTNQRTRTLLDDFINDIRNGKDIRKNQIYMSFKDKNYEVKDGPVYIEDDKISEYTPLSELRSFKKVGDKKVNAYQYENPEVKPFFQYEAGLMLNDLDNAIKGEKWMTDDNEWSGTKRAVTQDIADLLDGNYGVKLKYDEIRKGLNAIIKDEGSENIAAAKRIEMVLDKRLREGYTDSFGYEHDPTENYNKFLRGEEYEAPEKYDYNKMVEQYGNPEELYSLSEEQQKELNDYTDKLFEDKTLDERFITETYQKLNRVKNYSDFEEIKQEVSDYKDKMYKGISGLEDIVNLKPEDTKQREMRYTQLKDKNTNKQRRFFNNMETSPIIADETKNRVNATTYETKRNLDTLELMKDRLNERGNKLVEEWKTKSKNFTDKDVALGAILIERYQQDGDWESAARTVEKLADMGTEAGRAVQMYSIFQRLSPETMAIYQQKALNQAFEEMKKRQTGKWVEKNQDKFKLTAEETQFIYEQVEKASQAIDEETKQRELSKIENMINDKLPPEKGAAIKTLRRLAMLFNPKTQVRNVVGNALIMPVNDVADFIGTGIDRLIAKKTGVRTTSTASLKEKGQGFVRGIKQAVKDYKTGTRTTATGNKYEFETKAKPFNENTNSKVRNAINTKLNGLNDLLSAVMSGGDRPFYEAAYQNSLKGQMRANNVTEPTQDMIDIAVNEALQRTWNDDNEYTKTVLGIRKALNKANIGGFGLGDLIIPFAKTPANLTKAMVEYSPAGFIESVIDFNDMRKAISRGEMTPAQQKKFVASMSKAISGTLLYLIGGTLAAASKIRITGSADDDKDVKNFEQNVLGIQPYSVVIGDKSYTYSWANPINAPLAIMADTYKMSKENASTWDILNNAFKVAGETLVDNSFLSGIKELFSKDSISEGIVDAIESFPESLVPTFISQIASLGDKTQRQTFEYNNDLGTVTNKIKNKTPGLRNTLAPQVNTFGEEIENQNNVFNAFINPANVREARITDSQRALYDVYQETKDKTIFPMQAPYYVSKDGEKQNLTSQDRVTYQKASGQYVNEVYDGLFNQDAFNKAYHVGNEGKVEILKEIASDGNTKGKEAVGVTTQTTDKLNEKIDTLEDAGIPLADYYLVWYAQKNQSKKTAKKTAISQTIDYINEGDHKLDKDQKNVLYEIFNVK